MWGNNMIKKLIAAILFTSVSGVYAAPKLDPVSVSISRFQDTKNTDMVEASYIGIRCGALNSGLGEIIKFQAKGTDKEKSSAILIKALLDDGDTFKNVGFYSGIQAKESNGYMLDQFKYFLNLYGEEYKQGQLINQNGWTTYIDGEVRACETIKPFFRSVENLIGKP
jgi:hypothetical protein